MMTRRPHAAGLVLLVLAGCDSLPTALPPAAPEAAAAPAPAVEPEVVTRIPASLAPFGDGYPLTGDVCRLLGESELTANFLDDSAELVGCTTRMAAMALGGRIVATIDGVTLVSVPSRHRMPGEAGPD